MKVGIVVFPGSNCDKDTLDAFEKVLGMPTKLLWHKDTMIENCDLVVLPGGFSYGDYLRSGAIARFAPLMEAIIAHATQGGMVLGICNGFQILTEAGLLPGALLRNTSRQFISDDVYLKPCSRKAILSGNLDSRKPLRIPIAHGEGRYHIDNDGLQKLQDDDCIMFRYCDTDGRVGGQANPNGSLDDIAGICSHNGRVMGLMPHPERAVNPLLGLEDGIKMLQGLEAVPL
jgi:phosphoribosylformylglycinamidine synthase